MHTGPTVNEGESIDRGERGSTMKSCCDYTERPKRRDKLLGSHLPNEEKSKKAFTIQAEQEIWDIGKPIVEHRIYSLEPTQFGKNYHEFKYKFEPDYSSGPSFRLRWRSEIQNQEFSELLPEVIEGLTEKDPSVFKLAWHAYLDIMRHVPTEKLIDVVPSVTRKFRKVLSNGNPIVAHRVLDAMIAMAKLQKRILPTFVQYCEPTMQYFNIVMNKVHQCSDGILYKTDIREKLHRFIKLVIENSGDEKDHALHAFKRVIPIYQQIS